MTDTENVAPIQTLDDKIVQQIEYYFGDWNLPRDKFLKEQIKLDEGWVPISILLSFNRLANLSKDVAVIANAIKEGKSEIVSVSDDGLNIRRNIENPLPESYTEYLQTIKHCTVYMKGFDQNNTLDEIMEYCKRYGNVNNVLMRRTKGDRIFKGSVFVTYKTREEAEAAQKSQDKFGDIQLTKMMFEDYRIVRNKKEDQKAAKKATESVEMQNTKGLLLHVDGLREEATNVSVKYFFKQFGEVGYVVRKKGKTRCVIRFGGEEDEAKTAWEKAVAAGTDGKVIFQDKEITAKVLEGDEKEKYWECFHASKQHRQESMGSECSVRGGRGGRGRRGERAGRGSFRKGNRARGKKRHRENDATKPKRIVFADSDDEPVAAIE